MILINSVWAMVLTILFAVTVRISATPNTADTGVAAEDGGEINRYDLPLALHGNIAELDDSSKPSNRRALFL